MASLYSCDLLFRDHLARRGGTNVQPRRLMTPCTKAYAWSSVKGSFQVHISLYFKGPLCPIWYLMCAWLPQTRKQTGNEFRLEKLYPGTSSERRRLSHLTPRENCNNVIVWFPFEALCIFIYAKEFSKSSNWQKREENFLRSTGAQANKFFLCLKNDPSIQQALSSVLNWQAEVEERTSVK